MNEGAVGKAVRAGSSVCIPKRNLHAHKNVSDGLARMLVNDTPGRAYKD